MRYAEVDDILSVHGVGDTVLAQVSDYLKFNHNGNF
jgi:DNA uptake protein ComE-like DNA-binding protein